MIGDWLRQGFVGDENWPAEAVLAEDVALPDLPENAFEFTSRVLAMPQTDRPIPCYWNPDNGQDFHIIALQQLWDKTDFVRTGSDGAGWTVTPMQESDFNFENAIMAQGEYGGYHEEITVTTTQSWPIIDRVHLFLGVIQSRWGENPDYAERWRRTQ